MGVKINWYGTRFTRNLYTDIDRQEDKMVDRMVDTAKAGCPTKTGALRKSLVAVKNDKMDRRCRYQSH